MVKNFFRHFGAMNIIMIFLVFSIILVAEYTFFKGDKLDAIFIGLWAPTVLGFMNYLKR